MYRKSSLSLLHKKSNYHFWNNNMSWHNDMSSVPVLVNICPVSLKRVLKYVQLLTHIP